MSGSIPDAIALLGAAVKYLEQELMPTLSGYQRFQTRVTMNVLNTVRRELELRESQESSEHSRLCTLLGRDGTVVELRDELCARIRAGAIDVTDPVLRTHIKRSLADALAINNPKWLNE